MLSWVCYSRPRELLLRQAYSAVDSISNLLQYELHFNQNYTPVISICHPPFHTTAFGSTQAITQPHLTTPQEPYKPGKGNKHSGVSERAETPKSSSPSRGQASLRSEGFRSLQVVYFMSLRRPPGTGDSVSVRYRRYRLDPFCVFAISGPAAPAVHLECT